jgi:hypothetical protein
MGLNHMNGRVQDALLGRFLSPDPHIPSRGDAQSYNRYSYANNNPASNTDPTGFRTVPCVDNCIVPAGFGNLPPRLQQFLFAGQTNYASQFSNSENTGVGGLFGISGNNTTGDGPAAPTDDGSDLAPIVVTASKIPTNPDDPVTSSVDTSPQSPPIQDQSSPPPQSAPVQDQSSPPPPNAGSSGVVPESIVVTAQRTPVADPGSLSIMFNQPIGSTATSYSPATFYSPYRLFSKPDMGSFMMGTGIVGLGVGTTTTVVAMTSLPAAELSVDALALPLLGGGLGFGVGTVVGIVGYGVYLGVTQPLPPPPMHPGSH